MATRPKSRLKRIASAVADAVARRMPKLAGAIESGEEHNSLELFASDEAMEIADRTGDDTTWVPRTGDDRLPAGWGRAQRHLDGQRETTHCEMDIALTPGQNEKIVNAIVDHEVMHCGLAQIFGREGRRNILSHIAANVDRDTLAEDWFGRKIDNLRPDQEETERERSWDGTLNKEDVGWNGAEWYEDRLGFRTAQWLENDGATDKFDLGRSGDPQYRRLEQWIGEAFAFRTEGSEKSAIAPHPGEAPHDAQSMGRWADALGADIAAVYRGDMSVAEIKERYAPIADAPPALAAEAFSAERAGAIALSPLPGPQRHGASADTHTHEPAAKHPHVQPGTAASPENAENATPSSKQARRDSLREQLEQTRNRRHQVGADLERMDKPENGRAQPAATGEPGRGRSERIASAAAHFEPTPAHRPTPQHAVTREGAGQSMER